MDTIRDGDELGAVLNAPEGTSNGSPGHLARLKLAVHFREKKFVGHPSCQKKLTSIWYGDLRALEQAPVILYILFALGLTLIYPVLALLYWIYPLGKVVTVLIELSKRNDSSEAFIHRLTCKYFKTFFLCGY